MAAAPLSEFLKIHARTSLYTPPNAQPGQLIILCTWLGAARKHIAKYTSAYQSLAPEASILLIKSNAQIIASSYARQRREIIPAVSIVLDTLATCGYYTRSPTVENDKDSPETDAATSTPTIPSQHRPKPHILIHMFSNGGNNTATQMLLVLHTRHPHPIPITGLLFDSGPAHGTLQKSHQATVLSLRPQNTASWLLANLIVSCIMFALYSWIAWGNENPAALMRRTLLDEGMLCDSGVDGSAGTVSGEGEKADAKDGGNGGVNEHESLEVRKGRVAYLFSEADRHVDWRDIKEHAEEARRKGWEASEVVFDGSDHCAHFSKDRARYVDAMREMWFGGRLTEEE